MSSLVFSHLLSLPDIYAADFSSCMSARLTSSQLFSAHPPTISPFRLAKTCSKNKSRGQRKQPLRFPQVRFGTEKLLHGEALHRGFYTENPLHRMFYIQKLLHSEAFTGRCENEAFVRDCLKIPTIQFKT